MSSIRSLVTLLIATRTDPASVNIANFLFANYKWNQIQSIEEDDCKIFETSSKWGSKLYLWYINQCSLTLNHTNSLFCNQLSKTVPSSSFKPPQDILFLSRHSAASGTLSLTVHPVGIPWLTDNTHVGGIPGKCSPPSYRIASLYRALLNEAKAKGINDRFEVTMEATHHGPYVEVPACFVEIGSKEEEWTNAEAGEVWSQVLADHLGLVPKQQCGDASNLSEDMSNLSVAASDPAPMTVFNAAASDPVSPGGVVVVTIGGGHYVPKMNDMARFGEGLYTGHALTSYSVKPYLDGSTVESPVEGGWRAIVSEAIESTRLALPQAELICLIDKGAFNAEQRGHITRYLDEIGVKHTIKTDEVKKLWKSKCDQN